MARRFQTIGTMLLVLTLMSCQKPRAEPVAPAAPVSTGDPDAERRRQEEEERRRVAELVEKEALWLGDRARLEEMVFFDFDRADLSNDARLSVTRKAEILARWPAVTIRIDGHADERGSSEYNLALGMRRASMVKRFLVEHGVEAQRIQVSSFGEERPLDPTHTQEAWDRNRRAEFTILSSSQPDDR